MLKVYAGETARKILQDGGITADHFTTFLGASGGPKWFSLYGLDRYLFGDFFAQRKQPLDIIGSSAGAFRAACFAQANPVQAIERLAYDYSRTRYSEKVTAAEISSKARVLLDQMLGDNGTTEIINNTVFRAHFIVARVNGLAASENKYAQLIGLTKSYLANRVNRRYINAQYHRVIYQNPNSTIKIDDNYGFPTEHIDLSSENLKDALLASGSIPIVMQGISDIAGSPRGMYRDGGIIDYHFDINIDATPSSEPGLILYPHFSHSPKAGWFDKSLKRGIDATNYDRTVMLVPSEEFVAQLPYGKIPDREDFTKMDSEQRIRYWSQVLAQTEKLADDFNEFINNIHSKPMFTFT